MLPTLVKPIQQALLAFSISFKALVCLEAGVLSSVYSANHPAFKSWERCQYTLPLTPDESRADQFANTQVKNSRHQYFKCYRHANTPFVLKVYRAAAENADG